MENIKWIVCQLLSCWYLDLNFLDSLIWAYDIDLDIEEIQMNFWRVDNLNIFIFEAYEEIKDMFLENNKKDIEALWFNPDDFEAWKDYEIFTNYLDSHLRFTHEAINNMYEDWRRH